MNKITIAIGFFLMGCCLFGHAQRRDTYTVLQAGGTLGISSTNDQQAMHGYQFQFAFGRNFYDRLYLGLGIGNDVYRGRTTLADGSRSTRRVNTFPIFADARMPLARISQLGTLGASIDAGYAPRIGNDYFKGFVGKAGLTYGQLLAEGSDLLFSVGYGFQQFNSGYRGSRFSQHNVFITIGLFVH